MLVHPTYVSTFILDLTRRITITTIAPSPLTKSNDGLSHSQGLILWHVAITHVPSTLHPSLTYELSLHL